MLEINTIREFGALYAQQQDEILRALKVKDRLDKFLLDLNTPKKIEPHWVACKNCEAGVCKKCNKEYPGWYWYEQHLRDNSDIHPSQIDRCLKYLVLCCTGYADFHEERVNPTLRKIFDLGSAWHSVMQGYGAKGAWGDPKDYLPEAPIDPDGLTFDGTPILPIAAENWIKGSADALVTNYVVVTPSLGQVRIRLIHEYKTINSNGYTKLTRPLAKHKRQATIYSAVYDAPIVVYIYTNKDDCKTADFPVAFDYSIWNEIVARVRTVQSYTNSGQPIPWEQTSAVLHPSECVECGLLKVCQPPNLAQIRRF